MALGMIPTRTARRRPTSKVCNFNNVVKTKTRFDHVMSLFVAALKGPTVLLQGCSLARRND